MNNEPKISVIVPVSERYDDIRTLYHEYKHGLASTGHKYEFIYVLDGDFPDVLKQLKLLSEQNEPIKIIKLAKCFGEATALTAGFENSSGDVILTLPAYYQVKPSEIPKLITELKNYDMVIGRRWPRIDSRINRLQARIFHMILNFIADSSFHDLGCGVRAFKRQITLDVPVYGDQHRFFPLLASRQGFRIKELDVAQSAKDPFRRVYRLGVYPRRILDILTVFFLVKFTKKPLRFFGLIGASMFTTGGIILFYLVVERLFGYTALANRPALLLSSLLVVLGVQIFALGLIGELIIFTHAKDMKEYSIEKIVN